MAISFSGILSNILLNPHKPWTIEKQRIYNYRMFMIVALIFSTVLLLIRFNTGTRTIRETHWAHFVPGMVIALLAGLCLYFQRRYKSQRYIMVSSLAFFITVIFTIGMHGGFKSLYAGVLPLMILVYAAFLSPIALFITGIAGMFIFTVMAVMQSRGWLPPPIIDIYEEPVYYYLIVADASIVVALAVITILMNMLTEAQNRYSESINRYRTLVENAPDAIFVYNTKGYFSMVNRTALDLLGYENESELLMKNGEFVLPPDRLQEVQEYFLESLALKEKRIRDIELLRKDGSRIDLEIHLMPIIDNNGEVESFIGICRDISNRKRVEQETRDLQDKLILQDKMASLGRMVLGISHEYNNIFAGLRGYAQLAQIPGKENRLHELPEVVVNLVDRAQSITEGLLTFSEKFKPETGPIKPAELVEGIVRLMSKDFERVGVRVEHNIPENMEIITDGDKIQQVFLNLIGNARDAMPDGGMLKITHKKTDAADVIEFADNGMGIPDKLLPMIFEPFFTTKGAIAAGGGKGVGLGLSVCYSIIQALGGDMEVESEEGVGSVFRIILPNS